MANQPAASARAQPSPHQLARDHVRGHVRSVRGDDLVDSANATEIGNVKILTT
jgi:hypothetical protein